MKNPKKDDSFGSCLSVIPLNGNDILSLMVFTNENRSDHLSNVLLFRDYPNTEPVYLASDGDWFLDIINADDDAVLVAVAGAGVLRINKDRTQSNEIDTGIHDKFAKTTDGSSVISVGSNGNVHVRNMDVWTKIESGTEQDLYDAAGISANDFWICGGAGFLARYKDNEWKKIETGTNVSLNTATCLTDGSIYVAGESGIILSSNDGENFMSTTFDEIDFYGSCSHGSDILFSSPQFGLVKVQDGNVQVFQKGPKGFAIASNANYLGVAEDESLLVFDGEGWSGVPVF